MQHFLMAISLKHTENTVPANLCDDWDCVLWCDSPLGPTVGLALHQEAVCSLLSPYKCTYTVFEGPQCSSIIENI